LAVLVCKGNDLFLISSSIFDAYEVMKSSS